MAGKESRPNEGREELKEAFGDVLKMLQETSPQQSYQEGGALDFDEVIAKLEESLEMINQQMEEIHEKTGMTQEELEAYASNPENFTKEEWELLGEIRQELRKFEEETEEHTHHIQERLEKGGEKAPPTKKKKGKKKRGHWLMG